MWICLLKGIIYTFIMFLLLRNMVEVTDDYSGYSEEPVKFPLWLYIVFFITAFTPIFGEIVTISCIILILYTYIEGIDDKEKGCYSYIYNKKGKKNILFSIAKLLKTKI